tara:strand:+ start:27554 stop:28333 length:780 start_codon:yes stop_codon:yes gene_type:complete
MTNLMQHASRLALIATLSATPFVLSAQDTAVIPVDDGTNVEAEADASVTDGNATVTTDTTVESDTATDSAEAPVTNDSTATDAPSDTAAAPTADDATSTDTAEAPLTDNAGTTDTVADAPADEVAKPVEGQIAMQSENTILADDLIGSNIYSETGEKIGEVDDLIVHLNGSIEGVVIGVGGFLGIGEKWVALEMSSLSTATDESGTLRLVTSATKVDMEAADPFLTAQDLATAKQSLETMPPQDPNAAPVDGTVPAPSN